MRPAPLALRRLSIIGLVIGATTAGSATALAADYGSMYDDALLAPRQSAYREATLATVKTVLMPKLTDAERNQLGSLSFEFPLRGPRGGLLEFFAQSGGRVVIPVMAIRFVGEISLAYAWLQARGYAVETVADYLSMLKYQDAARFGGRYPAPRVALGIPDDAASDAAVDGSSQMIFNQSMAFIVLHEMGHVRYHHPGYGPDVRRADARKNEDEADQFALEILRRGGQPVGGLIVCFLSMAELAGNRADFASDSKYAEYLAADTHPLTGDRMARVAQYLRRYADDYARLQDDPSRAKVVMRGSPTVSTARSCRSSPIPERGTSWPCAGEP